MSQHSSDSTFIRGFWGGWLQNVINTPNGERERERWKSSLHAAAAAAAAHQLDFASW